MTDETDDDEVPGRLLEIQDVLRLVPVSRSTLVRMENEGRFPQGRYISANRKVWRAKEIAAWEKTLPKSPTGRPLGRPRASNGVAK